MTSLRAKDENRLDRVSQALQKSFGQLSDEDKQKQIKKVGYEAVLSLIKGLAELDLITRHRPMVCFN